MKARTISALEAEPYRILDVLAFAFEKPDAIAARLRESGVEISEPDIVHWADLVRQIISLRAARSRKPLSDFARRIHLDMQAFVSLIKLYQTIHDANDLSTRPQWIEDYLGLGMRNVRTHATR